MSTRLRLCVTLALLGVLAFASTANAEPPKVKPVSGHTAPLIVKITRLDGTSDTRMLVGVITGADGMQTHRYFGFGAGESRVRLWLDTIDAVSHITKRQARFALRDGTRIDLKHSGTPRLVFRLIGDGEEVIELRRLREVRILKSARADRKGNALFDHWKFSPFTGEKLPR